MELEEYKPLFDELRNESDRACAVLSRGILESHLRALLQKFFIKDQTKSEMKELFEGNGPLSTFSSRIKLCYSLGLIRKMERDALNSIRSISNEFAHSISRDFNFENKTISQKIESTELFHFFWNMNNESMLKLKSKYNTMREKFEFILGFLVGALIKRIEGINHLPDAKKAWPPIY